MSDLTRREFLRLAAASAVGAPAFLAACGRDKKSALNVLNWAGYIGKDLLSRFEEETGIAVNYSIYYKEDEMFGNLKAGAGYDLVVASDALVAPLMRAGLIVPMPHKALKNLGNILAGFRDPAYDRELAYSVPYLWGTTGIGFNTAHFSKPPDSWRALWDESNRGRVSMLDDAREAVQCALLLLELPTDSKDPAHLKQARELLLRQRPLVRKYTSLSYADDLNSGELWVSQSWSGDILQEGFKTIGYCLPREGAFRWVDSFCLVQKSSKKEEALRFVDYLLRPQVAAEICASVHYATPNEKALALLEPALRADPRVFPPPTIEAHLRPAAALDEKGEELWKQLWDEVRNS